MRALPMTAIAASSRCIRTSCSASEHHFFEDHLDEYKDRKGYTLDTDLSADDWKILVGKYKATVQEELGKPFPQDPNDQLWGAIGAVFGSWMNQRAIKYRELNSIPASWGTAVNVQAMVFGNLGETSATGRRLHAQSVHRREGALWRVPHQRAGRGRGGGHPHAAGHHRGGAHRGGLRPAVPRTRHARGLCRVHPHLRPAREALPRRAGRRVHHRARQALDAADAQRQAHRQGGAEDRGRSRQPRA